MTLEQFKKELLEASLKMGCESAEVYCSQNEAFSVEVLESKISKYKVANHRSLSLRVVYDGHDGFASTEVFENAEELISRAIDNAKSVDTEDDHPMYGKSEYKFVEMKEQPICNMTERECIDLAYEIENKALARDPRVKRTTGSSVFVDRSTVELSNTLGLDAKNSSQISGIYLGVVMKQGDEEKNGGMYYFGDRAHKVDEMVDEAIKDCASKFDASPVPVGEYRVLFTNYAFCDMLGLFESVFSADAVQKGLSLLAGKEGTRIASECVTLCDDPHNSVYPIPFDMEGVPTRYKNIIENGKLITFLHSLKTAKKAGTESTGNGTRTGACACTNIYLKPSEKSFDELVMGEKVLVISELDGAGTGVNEISGEFSLSAKGQLYENGERVRAVNQITVAGSFFDLLKNIIAVGNDLVFPYSLGMGVIGSPCVLVDKLIIAG